MGFNADIFSNDYEFDLSGFGENLNIIDVTHISDANSNSAECNETDDIIAPVSNRRRVIESETDSEISKEDSLEWIDVIEYEKMLERKQFTSGERSTGPYVGSNITKPLHFLNFKLSLKLF